MTYKNILWIDDCDDNDSGFESNFLECEASPGGESQADKERKEELFFEHGCNVVLEKNYLKALKWIEEERNQFDLIVFDINMRQGMDSMEFDEINERLKSRKVFVREYDRQKTDSKGGGKWREFEVKAGMYLYLFLLNCGYPNDRMLILTGNSTFEPIEFLKSAHIDPDQGIIFEKRTIRMEGRAWIDKFYQDSYYQIRRLVFQSCEYWKEELRSGKDIILFNSLYGKEETKISPESICNMLDRIQMLFPVSKPSNTYRLYYQAMQVAAMFHEESAKIQSLDKYPNIRCYHQAVRNFRNWSSHNKFEADELMPELFAVLYCSAIRSYFGDYEKPGSQFEGLTDYERQYFYCLKLKKAGFSEFKKQYLNKWKQLFNKLPVESAKKGKSSIKAGYECQNITELLVNCGQCETNIENGYMDIKDVIVSILGDWIVRNPLPKSLEWQETAGSHESIINAQRIYNISYTWKNEMTEEEYVGYLRGMKEKEPLKYYALLLFTEEGSR
ncbi:hypothetical protein GPL15_22070 [Clostridium sp. MCC353]|uniref:hypothetical protein n=1 Tax=Clostridium sp. MCC353 TaxID=2592646 RepID=UPI001C02E917|nr:hypothetical protein [Clostridium sp. MCC353]MBT9779169.1 hypothetical protein [Clostridium sp. MCC353]